MKQRRRHPGVIVMLLGVMLMLSGALALHSAGDTLQYVFPAPASTDGSDGLTALYRAGQEQLTSIGDTLTASAIAACSQGVSLSTQKGRNVTATVYAVGEGYFDVIHETLTDGRFVSGTDVARADSIIVIDEKTALTLFPGLEPVGQELTLGGVSYEVAGVIRGGRRTGEADAQRAYIPITAAGKNALAMQTVACVAKAVQSTGSAVLMEDTLRAWHPGGSFYSLSKLRMGAAMPLRWAILIAGVSLLLALLRRMNAVTLGRISRCHEQLRLRYARELAPGMAASAVLCALGYGAILALACALAVFTVQPLLVFTEWIPEVIVELSSLSSRFWSLNDAHAAAIRCVTREVCTLALGRGLLRWGFAALLLGLAMHGSRFLSRSVPMPEVRKER